MRRTYYYFQIADSKLVSLYSIDSFANRQVAKNDMKLLFFVLMSGRIAEFGIYGVGRPVWGREVKAGTYGNAVCLLIRVSLCNPVITISSITG